jgi:hypothetical protein
MLGPSMEENQHAEICTGSGSCAFIAWCTGAWANVQRVTTLSQAGPNFNAAMDETGSSLQANGRTAPVRGHGKVPCWREVPSSAVFEGQRTTPALTEWWETPAERGASLGPRLHCRGG